MQNELAEQFAGMLLDAGCLEWSRDEQEDGGQVEDFLSAFVERDVLRALPANVIDKGWGMVESEGRRLWLSGVKRNG